MEASAGVPTATKARAGTDALTRILECDPENERALWERADRLYQGGDLSEAMGDLHRLLALDPSNQKARQFKALILEKLGEKGWS